MVKNKSMILLIVILFFFVNSCSEVLGFFYSTDIDERWDKRNKLDFVNSLAPLSIGDSYSFIVLTDTHLRDGKLNGLDRLPKIIENNSQIKFAIVLGDITDSGAKKDLLNYIDIAHELSDDMGVPFYPVIGNHDIYNDGWKIWKEKIGSTIYRRDSGNTTLFILDSANNFYGKKQLDWLEKQLKTANKDVFVFSHVPLFGSGYVEWVQVTDLNERARMTSILKNKCHVMFTGHAHKKSVNEAGGVDYISLDAFSNDRDYCLVTVSNSKVNIQYLKM